MNKYKILEDQYIVVNGKKLYRIQALKDFAEVKAGDVGGYIEKESNLSQAGDAWVYGNARVYGNAWVYGDARVCGDAWVYGDARVCGNAWVCDNARVCGDAWVSGNAQVCGDAWVSKDRHYITLGPIGSRNGITTIYRGADKTARVICGCFSGTMTAFEAAVHQTHAGTNYEAEYMAPIWMARLREQEWTEENNE